jgi:hypothetical protein
MPGRMICQVCKNAYQREYYQRNRGRLLTQKAEYHIANRERRLTYAKKYRTANREREIEQDREYHQRNRETILQRQRQRRQDDPMHFVRLETLRRMLNPERKREKDRRYHARHRERRNEQSRRYRFQRRSTRLDYGWKRGAPTDRIQFRTIDGSQDRLRDYIDDLKQHLSVSEQAWIDQFLAEETPIPDHVLMSVRQKLGQSAKTR